MSKPALNNDYTNRELSWLEFDRRVLQQALDMDNPLLERCRFLSIVCSNLDEFFMVRVASVDDQRKAGYTKCDPSGMTPTQQLNAISARVRDMYAELYAAYRATMAELEERGVRILDYGQLTDEQKAFCSDYFESNVYPTVSPITVSKNRLFPFVPGKGLNVGVLTLDQQGGENIATVQLPSALPRMIELPSESGKEFLPMEELVCANIGRVFPKIVILAMTPYRVMRNGDLDAGTDEAGDLLNAVKKSLSMRKSGCVVRLEVGQNADERLVRQLQKRFGIGKKFTYETFGPINLNFLSKQLCDLDLGIDTVYRPFEPSIPERLRGDESIFDVIKQGDVLLYHPFDSFSPVIRLISESADDPSVVAIKITLYRLSKKSPIVESLCRAARNGKLVTAFIEARARFDEENNIEYGAVLEKAGVNVVYGLPKYKTHSKITLVLRREQGEMHKYLHLGTGNYNDSTARQYTDYSLLTTDAALGADGVEFFHSVTGGMFEPDLEQLVMAPFMLRDRFEEEIKEQRRRARNGGEGYIFAKMNSLVDPKIIEKLYKAARDGVKIELVVRGICCLRTDCEAANGNIEVRSVVGRFLEHSRVYIFGRDDDRRVYLSSADWMQRNLNRRVELMFPLRDKAVEERVVEDMRCYWRDNVKARRLCEGSRYEKLINDEEPYNVQEAQILAAKER